MKNFFKSVVSFFQSLITAVVWLVVLAVTIAACLLCWFYMFDTGVENLVINQCPLYLAKFFSGAGAFFWAYYIGAFGLLFLSSINKKAIFN